MSENKWTAFADKQPDRGIRILVAWIIHDQIRECIMMDNWGAYPIDSRFNYWVLGCVLPEVPKRDYCREAWENLPPVNEPFSRNLCRFVPAWDGGLSVNLDVYRVIWNAAIACAKENGLEKV